LKNKFMENLPEEIILCNLEVVLMPNGEVICCGKTVCQTSEAM